MLTVKQKFKLVTKFGRGELCMSLDKSLLFRKALLSPADMCNITELSISAKVFLMWSKL